jgi:hypothetical protein
VGFNSSCFILAVVLFVAAAQAGDLQKYKNENWGFSVVIPGSMRIETSKPPNPNHGFQIHISREAFAWANADSSDDLSLSGAAEAEERLWIAQGCKEIEKAGALLGGKSAEKLQLDCPAGLARTDLKRISLIVTLQAPPGINDASYVVGVAFKKGSADEQLAVSTLNALQKGFRFYEPALGERKSRAVSH